MVNKVILIGNLGVAPELRHTQNGTPVASLRLATSRRRKDQQTGEWIDETEWHRVTVWGKSAEFCNNYLTKGSRVYVEGRLQTRKWQDQNGLEATAAMAAARATAVPVMMSPFNRQSRANRLHAATRDENHH